jgi:hypothetical protein
VKWGSTIEREKMTSGKRKDEWIQSTAVKNFMLDVENGDESSRGNRPGVPGLKLAPSLPLNDNTLYTYSESQFDTKSKNTPLFSQRAGSIKMNEKEIQEVGDMEFTENQQFNNGGSQLNLSSIEAISP